MLDVLVLTPFPIVSVGGKILKGFKYIYDNKEKIF